MDCPTGACKLCGICDTDRRILLSGSHAQDNSFSLYVTDLKNKINQTEKIIERSTSNSHIVRVQRVKLPHVKVGLGQLNRIVLIMLISKDHFLQSFMKHSIALELMCFPGEKECLGCQQLGAMGHIGRAMLQFDSNRQGRINCHF